MIAAVAPSIANNSVPARSTANNSFSGSYFIDSICRSQKPKRRCPGNGDSIKTGHSTSTPTPLVATPARQLQIHCFHNQLRSTDDSFNKIVNPESHSSSALSPLPPGKNLPLLRFSRSPQDVPALLRLRP